MSYSFVTTELVSLGRRISADTGCAGCRVERTVLCEAHTYTAAPTSSKNAQEHQLVPSFLEVYIEVPFRKNVNGKSGFSVYVPDPLRISWEIFAEKFARNFDIIGGIIGEHPRINKWIFQPFLCSICMVI